MAVVLFDLDNTLLAGDSDYLWGVFLTEKGLVDRHEYEQANARFYEEYKQGKLDIHAFLAFSLKPLSQHPLHKLQQWRQQFMAQKIEPLIRPQAMALVEKHRAKGDTLVVITATNAFITLPIARRFGIDHLIATEPEMHRGRYTGRVTGIPCFQEGKVQRIQQWLTQHRKTLDDAWFYSDSHNDLPLLKKVPHPVAVDPDTKLRAHAQAHGWPILQLHHANST